MKAVICTAVGSHRPTETGWGFVTEGVPKMHPGPKFLANPLQPPYKWINFSRQTKRVITSAIGFSCSLAYT